jgi:hypothetical protein
VNFPHSVGPGDPIPTDAATWNAILGAAHAHRRGDRPQPGGGGLSFGGVVEAFALNSTGAALAPNRPAAVTAAGGIDVTGDGGPPWQRTPVVTLGVPGASADFIVVTLEAIPAGQIGRVAVAGAVLCNLKVNNAGHGYAAPTTNTTALESAATGPIRVLHKGTGSSTRRCLVYLGDQVAAPALTPPLFRFVQNIGGVTLNQASGVWQDIVTTTGLPAADYLIMLQVMSRYNSGTPGDFLMARIVTSANTPVFNNTYVNFIQVAGVEVYNTACTFRTNTLAAGDYKLQVARFFTTTPTVSVTESGQTGMAFMPITGF